MKGNNKLSINHDTMCAALQVWVDQTFASAIKPKVTKVEESKNSGSYSAATEFTVTVESAEVQAPRT